LCTFLTLDAASFSHVDLDVTPESTYIFQSYTTVAGVSV
jgi:hypothetical protein